MERHRATYRSVKISPLVRPVHVTKSPKKEGKERNTHVTTHIVGSKSYFAWELVLGVVLNFQ